LGKQEVVLFQLSFTVLLFYRSHSHFTH